MRQADVLIARTPWTDAKRMLALKIRDRKDDVEIAHEFDCSVQTVKARLDLYRAVQDRLNAMTVKELKAIVAGHRTFEERFPDAKLARLAREADAKRPKRYYLENRYQDSGWQTLDETFGDADEAIRKALEYAKNSIVYGMVRVMDRTANKPIITVPAGGFYNEETVS